MTKLSNTMLTADVSISGSRLFTKQLVFTISLIGLLVTATAQARDVETERSLNRYVVVETDTLPDELGYTIETDGENKITGNGCARLAESSCGSGNVDTVDFERRGFRTSCNISCTSSGN